MDQERAGHGVPLGAVDPTGVDRGAVAPFVDEVEELDAGEGLAALDRQLAQADLVVVPRVDLSAERQIEEVERIARVGHEADRLGEPQLAVVVGIVEVHLADEPQAALDAALGQHEVDAAIEPEGGDGLELGNVGTGAVGVGAVGDVEALGDVGDVAGRHVLVDAVGVEAEREVRVHLERRPQAHLEADDLEQRNVLLELVLQLRQLIGHERRRLPHHQLEEVERVLEERDTDAAPVGGVVGEEALLLLLLVAVGVGGRQRVDGRLRVGVGLRGGARAAVVARGPLAEGQVVVHHAAILVRQAGRRRLAGGGRLLDELLREPEPPHRNLDVDARGQRRDPGDEVVDRRDDVDHRADGLALGAAVGLEEVHHPDGAARDVGKDRDPRVEELQHRPDLFEVRFRLVDGRLEELREEAADVEPDVVEPDLRLEIHFLEQRRGRIDALVSADGLLRRFLDPLLLLDPLDEAHRDSVVAWLRRLGLRGRRGLIGRCLLGLLDPGPGGAGAPVEVEVGEDPRDRQVHAGGFVGDRQIHRQICHGVGVEIDLEDVLGSRAPELPPRDPARRGVGIDVRDRVPALGRADRFQGVGHSVVDEGAHPVGMSADDAVHLLEPRELDPIPLLGVRAGRDEREARLGEVVGARVVGNRFDLALGVELGRPGLRERHVQLRGSQGRARAARGGVERDDVILLVVLDLDVEAVAGRLVDQAGQDRQRDERLVGHQPEGVCARDQHLPDRDHRPLEVERRGAERDVAGVVAEIPPGVLVRPSPFDEHEDRLAAAGVEVGVVVRVERAAPAAGGDGVDPVLLGERLALDEHAVAHLELDAVDDAHAPQRDVPVARHPDREIEGGVLGRWRDLELVLVVLLGVHARNLRRLPEQGREGPGPAGLGDRAGVALDDLAERIHDPPRAGARRRAGRFPDGEAVCLGARVGHVEAHRRRKPRGQLVVAVDARRLVVTLFGRDLRPVAGVVEILRVDVREPGQTAADLVGGRQAEEEQAAGQLGRLHRRDLDQGVRVGTRLGHVHALVVELRRDEAAVAAVGADDPPDLLALARRRRLFAAAARVVDGRVGGDERRDVGGTVVDGDRAVGLAGQCVDHVGVVGGDGRALGVDDLPVIAARIPPLRVVLRGAGERGVETELRLELAGGAAEITPAPRVAAAVHLDVEAVGDAEPEAKQHFPADLQPQAAVEGSPDADVLQRIELEAEVDAGVEHLLAQPEDDLEGIRPADVIREDLAVLVHEHDADVLGTCRRHHGVERAIHADGVVLEQDVRVLGAEILEHRLPHDVEDALAGTPHLVPHVEQPAGTEAENRTDRATELPLHEGQRNLVEALERALHAADRGVELVEDHGRIADVVDERLLGPEQVAGVLELGREGEQDSTEILRGRLQPPLPRRPPPLVFGAAEHAEPVGLVAELDALVIDGLLGRRERQDRVAGLLQPADRVEIASEVGHREVEAGRMVREQRRIVDARQHVLLALHREVGPGECVEDRHDRPDLPAERGRVVVHREGVQLAGAGVREDVEAGRIGCPECRGTAGGGRGVRDQDLGAVRDLRDNRAARNAVPGDRHAGRETGGRSEHEGVARGRERLLERLTVEFDHQLAVLQLGRAVPHVQAELCRELQVLAVDGERDLERRAVGDAMIGRAVMTVEERLFVAEVVADREHARRVDDDAERRFRIAVGQAVDALRHRLAEQRVVDAHVDVERDRGQFAGAVGEVDPVGLADAVVADPQVG